MRTDNLIAALAADTAPGPTVTARALRGVPAALAVVVALVALILGVRPDLAASLMVPLSVTRFGFVLLLAALAGAAVLRLARPGARALLWPPLLVAAGAVGLWASVFAATPPDARGAAITGRTLVYCLTAIPALSVITTAAILWALRQGAPLRPGLAGFMAGITGGALATAAYALHCTEDNPLFYVTWYGTGILVAGLGGAIAGRRLLRW